MNIVESNLNNFEKALENMKSAKGRLLYNGQFNNDKLREITRKLNLAINTLEEIKKDYTCILRAEDNCKKQTMSENDFNSIFTLCIDNDDRRSSQLKPSEKEFLIEEGTKILYKKYVNMMRLKFELSPIVDFGDMGDVDKIDPKKVSAKVDEDKNTIILRIYDNELKSLLYNGKGTNLYSKESEYAIELVRERSYGFRLINLNARSSLFIKIIETIPENITFEDFRDKFKSRVRDNEEGIIFEMKKFLDSIKDYEIEFKFEGDK